MLWPRIQGTPRYVAGLPEVQSLTDPWNALWELQQTGLWRGGKPLGRKTQGKKGTFVLAATLPIYVKNKAKQTWAWQQTTFRSTEVFKRPMTEHSCRGHRRSVSGTDYKPHSRLPLNLAQGQSWDKPGPPRGDALHSIMLLLIQSLCNVSLSA